MIGFDMDGVLADTQRLVIDCYKAVGVTVPDDGWSKSFRSWGVTVTHEQHEEKTRLYVDHVARYGVRPLDGFDVLRGCQDNALAIVILTGADKRAARAVLESLGVYEPFLAGLSIASKADAIDTLGVTWYLDDDEATCVTLSSSSARVVRYTPGTPDSLIYDAWRYS